jgi:hypothetical protein
MKHIYSAWALVAALAFPAAAQVPEAKICPFTTETLDAIFGVVFERVDPYGDIDTDESRGLACSYESKQLVFRVLTSHYKKPAQAQQHRAAAYDRKDRILPIPKDEDGAAFIETRDGPTPTLQYARNGVAVTLLLFTPAIEPIKGNAALIRELRTKLTKVPRLPQ